MINIPEKKYFHCYATANDNRYYFRDIQNLLKIKNTYSGVSMVNLYIAISEVKRINWTDKFFIWAVKKLFFRHSSIELKKIFFKSNIGRDFSSYATMSDLIQAETSFNDYVFFQNRSAYGPYKKDWLKEIIVQFEKKKLTALCGSTINFRDHPSRSKRTDLPHVQTYAFLTKVSFLKMLGSSFPGRDETLRLDIICNGEIGLSQFFLNSGYAITCMEWPDKFITNESDPVNVNDIKAYAEMEHQFYHKSFFTKKERGVYKIVKYLKVFFLFVINCVFIKR